MSPFFMRRDYWSVYGPDGRKIADCGMREDAIRLASLVSGRTYRKNMILRDQVIDITAKVDGELPGQQGLPVAKIQLEDAQQQWIPPGLQIPFEYGLDV